MCYRNFLSEQEKKDICVIKELGNHETSLQMLGKEMKGLYISYEISPRING